MKYEYDPVIPVTPPAPWLGGKRVLAPKIIQRISEVQHVLYAEPFVGMGGVFLRRDRRPQAEAINDYSGEVINLFRILQRHYAAFMEHLKYQLTSRREFERLLKTPADTLTDLERAARFLYLQRTSFGGKTVGQNYGVAPERPARFDLTRLAPVLEDIYERLTCVSIENLPWAEFIERYDRPTTLFYLDPPYWGNENDYGKSMFGQDQFAKIANLMGRVEGKVILSLNNVPGVRETFADFRMEFVELKYTIGKGQAKQVSEVLIYNFERPEMPLFKV